MMGTRHWPEDADNEVERLEGIIKQLYNKLKIAEEALHTGIMSLKTGYPEYDSDDTLEILSEALAEIRGE
jgi:hypothetical protein